MRIRAAILWEQGQPLCVEAAELDAPGPGEVLVEIKAAGVCHSDLHPARGDWAMRVPVVLGHEGAGIVRGVGPAVTPFGAAQGAPSGSRGARVREGDHVVLCWAPACGVCPPCKEGRAVLCDRLEKVTYRNKLPSGAARLHARGQDVAPFLGTACFSDFVIVPEEAAVPVPRDLRFDALATLGCAVLTGVGAVTNAARVPPGSRVVVIGAGGIGLNVIQGAAIEKCDQIVAVDLRPAPLALAKQFGATHTIDASANVPAAIRDLTAGRGADFVFDTVGSPATLATALACARKGGAVVLTGLSRQDSQGSIAMFPFVMQEKRLIGSVYGSGQPLRDIPRLVALYQAGTLKLNELVSRTYALDKVNTALTALAASDGARGVILW
ncbi:MAG: Zn-dependent alcohol dehydrogenase [Acidobacteria bacterium]|nr:Zn-dependent alcohol dehydrogenase [Acidobacteriota bacterium]